MKIYGIRNEAVSNEKDLAFLFYFERSDRFFIEIPSDADVWELPIILSNYAEKKRFSLDSEAGGKWVHARVVPEDRQNLGMILRENRMNFYDVHRMLVLSEGRCAQDDCFLVPLAETDLPAEIRERLARKIADVMPLPYVAEQEGYSKVNVISLPVLVFFRDDTTRRVDLLPMIKDDGLFGGITQSPERVAEVRVSPGGNGIEWDDYQFLSAETLYRSGEAVSLPYGAVKAFIEKRVLTVTEMAETMHVSRQYVNQLVKDKRLLPVKSSGGGNLLLRGDLERGW